MGARGEAALLPLFHEKRPLQSLRDSFPRFTGEATEARSRWTLPAVSSSVCRMTTHGATLRLPPAIPRSGVSAEARLALRRLLADDLRDRKSTRLNSSH